MWRVFSSGRRLSINLANSDTDLSASRRSSILLSLPPSMQSSEVAPVVVGFVVVDSSVDIMMSVVAELSELLDCR